MEQLAKDSNKVFTKDNVQLDISHMKKFSISFIIKYKSKLKQEYNLTSRVNKNNRQFHVLGEHGATGAFIYCC